jgi:hypothetical protein
MLTLLMEVKNSAGMISLMLTFYFSFILIIWFAIVRLFYSIDSFHVESEAIKNLANSKKLARLLVTEYARLTSSVLTCGFFSISYFWMCFKAYTDYCYLYNLAISSKLAFFLRDEGSKGV